MKIGNFNISRLKVISIAVALCVALPMVIGMAFRIYYFKEAGQDGQGYNFIINDPGKVFFQLVLIPIIAYTLVKFAPYNAFEEIIKQKAIFYPALLVIIFFFM